MSRKWERMVKKNTKLVNKSRVKHGKATISQSVSDGSVTIKGRNWTLSLFLLCVGIFSFLAYRNTYQDDFLYWMTGGSYILLSLFIFAVRRPHLKIGKDFLGTRRFTGDKRVAAADIKEISLSKDSVVITLNGSKAKWGFTRFYHRIDITSMSDRLKVFAADHAVPLKVE
jgi:hypothetical protein